MKIISFCILTGMLITACKTSCSRPELSLIFRGFDSVDKSTMMLNTYQQGTNFTKHINTEVFITSWNSGRGIDTYSFSDNAIPISHDEDIILYFPLISKTYTIKDISIHNDRIATREENCTDGVSYIINDTPVSFPGYDNSIPQRSSPFVIYR